MFQFLFCYILGKKDKKGFKRDIIVLISFLIIFVLISCLVNIGKEMSLPGFRTITSYIIFVSMYVTITNLLSVDVTDAVKSLDKICIRYKMEITAEKTK